LDSLGFRGYPISGAFVARDEEEPRLLLRTPSHRRKYTSARRISEMRVFDDKHHGRLEHSLKQVCDQLRNPLGTMGLLQVGDLRARRKGYVEHNTE